MLTELKRIIEKHEKLTIEDMQLAASYLLSHQFIYLSESRDRKHYRLIDNFRLYFEKLFDALGFGLTFDPDYQYIGIIPEHAFHRMKLEDSLMLLTMRQVYEDEMRRLESEHREGIILVTYEKFLMRYEGLTGREKPDSKASPFKDRIKSLSRFGVTKLESKSNDPLEEPRLKIYAGIMSLINLDTLKQITEYKNEYVNDEVTEENE